MICLQQDVMSPLPGEMTDHISSFLVLEPSNFSREDVPSRLFEISAPHFQVLYKTFKEFKLLKQDFIVSSGITDESKKVIFKKIRVDKYNLYLLLFLQEFNDIEKIELNLPDFSNILVDLMKTFI